MEKYLKLRGSIFRFRPGKEKKPPGQELWILKERRCFICLDLMEQDLGE